MSGGGVCEILSSKISKPDKVYRENFIVECGVVTPMIHTPREECKKRGLSREEESMVQTVCRLLEDDELRSRLSRNALTCAKNFSQEQIAEKWLTIMEKMA